MRDTPSKHEQDDKVPTSGFRAHSIHDAAGEGHEEGGYPKEGQKSALEIVRLELPWAQREEEDAESWQHEKGVVSVARQEKLREMGDGIPGGKN